MNQDILFILYFLTINFLCFSLGYLVNIKQQPNPFSFFKNVQDIRSLLRVIYKRDTSDFLRINVDCASLILLFRFINIEVNLASHIIAVVCLWGLIYMTYLFTIAFLFRRLPMIQADINFMAVGLTLLKNKKYILFIAVLILLIVFYFLFFYLASNLLPLKVSNIIYFLMFIGIGILGFRHLSLLPFPSHHTRAFISPTIHFIKNVINSNKYANLLNFEVPEVLLKNTYSSFKLHHKPDIVIISVESLGSIAYKDEEIFTEIKNVLIEYQEKFSVRGIHIASSYSTPPQFGGGSWLSVGSLLYGYKMENDIQYNAIFKNKSNFRSYESMIHYFKNQGYNASMISTLGGFDESDVDWEKIKNVYPMDFFVKWQNLGYRGKAVDFLATTSYCPPDQYSLWKGMEMINSQTTQPKISVFPTLNSHSNWDSPLTLESDYKRLDIIDDFETTTNTKKPKKANYIRAIIYQLELVLDYVHKNPNKIYVIFGDHQPPFITPDSFGFETPLYVLSTNQDLTDGFRQEGFNKDLINLDNNIRHEGFYSLFMKSFLRVYSHSNIELPILPNGIIFDCKSPTDSKAI